MPAWPVRCKYTADICQWEAAVFSNFSDLFLIFSNFYNGNQYTSGFGATCLSGCFSKRPGIGSRSTTCTTCSRQGSNAETTGQAGGAQSRLQTAGSIPMDLLNVGGPDFGQPPVATKIPRARGKSFRTSRCFLRTSRQRRSNDICSGRLVLRSGQRSSLRASSSGSSMTLRIDSFDSASHWFPASVPQLKS